MLRCAIFWWIHCQHHKFFFFTYYNTILFLIYCKILFLPSTQHLILLIFELFEYHGYTKTFRFTKTDLVIIVFVTTKQEVVVKVFYNINAVIAVKFACYLVWKTFQNFEEKINMRAERWAQLFLWVNICHFLLTQEYTRLSG